MNYSKILVPQLQDKKLSKETEKSVGLFHQLPPNSLLMLSCVLGNVLKLKCKLLHLVLIPLVWFLLSIKYMLKKEQPDYLKLLDLCGLDKFLIPLLNLLPLNTLQNKCINMFSLNLNLIILIPLNSELPLLLVIQLVFSVPSSLTLPILWFLN